jgi:hypothetical protein
MDLGKKHFFVSFISFWNFRKSPHSFISFEYNPITMIKELIQDRRTGTYWRRDTIVTDGVEKVEQYCQICYDSLACCRGTITEIFFG